MELNKIGKNTKNKTTLIWEETFDKYEFSNKELKERKTKFFNHGFLYIPEDPNFPCVNAMLVTKKCLVLIQITIKVRPSITKNVENLENFRAVEFLKSLQDDVIEPLDADNPIESRGNFLKFIANVSAIKELELWFVVLTRELNLEKSDIENLKKLDVNNVQLFYGLCDESLKDLSKNQNQNY